MVPCVSRCTVSFVASKIARTCHHHLTGCAGVDSEARLKLVLLQDSSNPHSALDWVRRLAFCLAEGSWKKHIVTIVCNPQVSGDIQMEG